MLTRIESKIVSMCFLFLLSKNAAHVPSNAQLLCLPMCMLDLFIDSACKGELLNSVVSIFGLTF